MLALKDESPEMRIEAAAALVKMKLEPKLVVPVILDIATMKDSPAYTRANELTKQFGEWTRPVVTQLLNDIAKEDRRPAAILGLAAMGKPVVPDVVRRLEVNRDAAQVLAVYDILTQMGPNAKSALSVVNVLAVSKNEDVKAAAKKASLAIQMK